MVRILYFYTVSCDECYASTQTMHMWMDAHLDARTRRLTIQPGYWVVDRMKLRYPPQAWVTGVISLMRDKSKWRKGIWGKNTGGWLASGF